MSYKDDPEFDSAMSAEELAKYFDETPILDKKVPVLETKEEVEKWEEEQLNSSDIYRIAARVKNLARGTGASLTSAGEALCNSYVHIFKDLYDFAETIPDPYKGNLIELVRKHEGTPANLIAALGSGVRKK